MADMTADFVLSLVRQALDALEGGSSPLGQVLQKAARIARLRDDYINWWWVQLELVPLISKQAVVDIQSQVAPRIPREQFQVLRVRFGEAWVREREALVFDEQMKQDKENIVLAAGVGEIEVEVEKYRHLAAQQPPPEGLHPLDLYFVQRERSELRTLALALEANRRSILERIKVRVHAFLSETEAQLVQGQFHSDLFERNRRYVDLQLQRIAPDALAQLTSAFARGSEPDPEARSQALLSCRRVLKSLADALYPASAQPVIGADSQERVLTDEKYISRLWQFAHENVGRTTPGELLLSQIQDLGNRIDRLYDLTSKGVHADVSASEVDQCVIQTYLLAGDLLRIHERSSAIGLETGTPPH